MGQNNNYIQDWDFFFTEIEENPASIFTDLGLMKVIPLKEYKKVLTILIEINNPDKNGFPSNEESETLFKIEDKIKENLSVEYDTIFAGRMTYDGSRILYFYLNNDKGLKVKIEELLEEFEDYRYSAEIENDANWSKYKDYLFPQNFEMQTIINRRVLRNIRSHGDNLDASHEISHFIYFRNIISRNGFKEAINELGYNVTKEGVNENSEDPFSIIITRIDKISDMEINDITAELYDLAEEHNGAYDGWETKIIPTNN